jgi:hypothetical protein
MESPFLKEIYEEGRLERQQEILVMLLQTKFGDLPKSVQGRIKRMKSDKTFDRLLQKVVTARSLEELGFK